MLALLIPGRVEAQRSSPAPSPIICAEADEAALIDSVWRIEKLAYNRLGLQPRLVTYPSRRCISDAANGLVQGLLYRTTSIEAILPEMLRVPTPLGRVNLVAIGRQSDLIVDGWEQLRPWRIAALRGRTRIEQMTAGMQVVFVANTEQMLRMLDADRVDVLVAERSRTLPRIEELRAQGLELRGVRELGLIDSLPVYHYLHKSQAALLNPLDQQFRALIREGFADKVPAPSRQGLPEQDPARR
ncbi:MAG: hypothetical protein C0423_18040 [Methylibium sp.]|nr:hypothetical protein [Methylibium sp.]